MSEDSNERSSDCSSSNQLSKVHPIAAIDHVLEFLTAWRSEKAQEYIELLRDVSDERDRLRHAIQNIQIQVSAGSEAREICDRVLRGEFYP